MALIEQLRIFDIRPGAMDAFLDAWLKGVYPLRLRHGYQIPSAWVVEADNRFYWLLTYDGPEDWAEKDRAYYASADRAAVDPDPRQYIMKVEQRFVRRVLPRDE